MSSSRIELAATLLEAGFEDLLDLNGLGGRYFAALSPYAPLDSQTSTAERIFLDGLRVRASRQQDVQSGLRVFLALMLFAAPHRLRVRVEWRSLPIEFALRLLRSQLRFLAYFEFDDDAALHIEHLRKVCEDILSTYKSLPDAHSFGLLDLLARELNLMLTYFSTVELRPVNEVRARLLETWLRACGCKLDYELAARKPGDPIRVGFLAQAFLGKTETFYTLPVFRHFDRSRFSAHLFAFGQVGDAAERLCIEHADSFQILPANISDAAACVRQAGLDVLFFVSNLLAWSSPSALMACHRLARVQVTTGLSPATTGFPAMDSYFVGTRFKLAQEHYSESLAWIDGLGLCIDQQSMQATPEAVLTRDQLGIPAQATAFVSGANVYKINPGLMRTWATVLQRVPGSVLVLYPFGPNWSNAYSTQEFIQFLGRIASSCGTDPDRIKIAGIQGGSMVRALLRNCDIYLDSFPYGGTTSVVDALESRLPAVTLMGPTFREQMSGRLLVELGFPGYACETEEAYVELAVRLGEDVIFRSEAAKAFQAAYSNNPAFHDTQAYGAKMQTAFGALVDG